MIFEFNKKLRAQVNYSWRVELYVINLPHKYLFISYILHHPYSHIYDLSKDVLIKPYASSLYSYKS